MHLQVIRFQKYLVPAHIHNGIRVEEWKLQLREISPGPNTLGNTFELIDPYWHVAAVLAIVDVTCVKIK